MLSQALFNHKLDAVSSNETNQLQTSEYSSAGSVSSTNGSISPSNRNVTSTTNVQQTETSDKDSAESTNNNSNLITDGDSSFNESSDEIKEFEQRWGYNIANLFDICLKFYKNNESKAFHPTFDQRNRLNALVIQAKHGKYDEKKMPEIGVLDLVGKNRRHQWSLLGDMSKLEAKYRFILIIDEICPLFKAFVEAIRLDRNDDSLADSSNSCNSHNDNHEVKQQNDNQSNNNIDNNNPSNDDTAANKEALDDPNKLAQTMLEQQNKAIYEILCKQTYEQFSNYAYNQYPNDETKREYLVQKLQLQYYNQYMQQVYQQQQQTAHKTNSPVASDTMQHSQNQNNNCTTEEEEIPNKNARLDASNSNGRDVIYESKVDDIVETTANIDINQDKSSSDSLADTDHTGDDEEEHEEHDEDDDWPIDSHNLDLSVATPSLWTRNTIDEFKESIRNEGRSGIFVVHFGESVTVRAPTHPNGKSIYWEFATDNFDIGFGVLFQFEKDPTKDHAQSINYDVDGDADTNTDEDDNQNYLSTDREKCDIENGIFKDNNINSNSPPPPPPSKSFTSIVVIPIYRRDSHEEVYAGRHDYPGQGTYIIGSFAKLDLINQQLH